MDSKSHTLYVTSEWYEQVVHMLSITKQDIVPAVLKSKGKSEICAAVDKMANILQSLPSSIANKLQTRRLKSILARI